MEMILLDRQVTSMVSFGFGYFGFEHCTSLVMIYICLLLYTCLYMRVSLCISLVFSYHFVIHSLCFQGDKILATVPTHVVDLFIHVVDLFSMFYVALHAWRLHTTTIGWLFTYRRLWDRHMVLWCMGMACHCFHLIF